MSWDYWGEYHSRPRRPANGIKAQTQRGRFGKTWWASLWLAALEQLVDPARLARGRSYARSGQVTKLEVGCNGVAALVQGSRPSPYEVSIQFRTLSDKEWDRVTDAIASQAIYAAMLLSGEMPAQIQDVFQAAGASLFPAKGDDLETDCSCPDWANPCKHVAAVYYLLGERFEADPFLIFEMRGRSKEGIIAELRAKRLGELPPEAEATEGPGNGEELVVPLSESLENFWSVPDGILDMAMDFSEPSINALSIKQLGRPSFWHSQRDFTELMEQAYGKIGARALRIALGDDSRAAPDQRRGRSL